jgi:hypothetical protein
MKPVAFSAAVFTLAAVLTGCNEVVNQVIPDAHKAVTADGKVYLACSGSVDVSQSAYGFRVHLYDRDWNSDRTYTDTEVYLQAKQVSVRPMNSDELNVCRTGGSPTATDATTKPKTEPKTLQETADTECEKKLGRGWIAVGVDEQTRPLRRRKPDNVYGGAIRARRNQSCRCTCKPGCPGGLAPSKSPLRCWASAGFDPVETALHVLGSAQPAVPVRLEAAGPIAPGERASAPLCLCTRKRSGAK